MPDRGPRPTPRVEPRPRPRATVKHRPPAIVADLLSEDEERFAHTVRSIEALPLFRKLAARGLVRRSPLSGWIPADRYRDFLDTEMLPLLRSYGLGESGDWLRDFGAAGPAELAALSRAHGMSPDTVHRIRAYARYLLHSDDGPTSPARPPSEAAGRALSGVADEPAQGYLERFVHDHGLTLDQFRRYVLQAEGPAESVAVELGLPPDELRRARDAATSILVLDAMDQGEPWGPSHGKSAPEPGHMVVAAVRVSPGGLPHLALAADCEYAQVYRLSADAVAAARAAAGSPEEAAELLRMLRLANQRKSTLYRVLVEVLRAQAAYFSSGQDRDLAPLFQAEVARRLGEHRSVVCRALRGRSLELGGRVIALSFFFQSRGRVIGRLVGEYPTLPDSAVADILERRFGLRLDRRTVAYHRRRNARGKGR